MDTQKTQNFGTLTGLVIAYFAIIFVAAFFLVK
jgi:hypothetical protein